jgi:hypothetical protein
MGGDTMKEQMVAVAIRDGEDLFLWLRIRRAPSGDIYYMFPTGRPEREWKKWDPHGTLHADGRSHHKSFDQKISPQQTQQKPDADFKGTVNFVTRPIAASEPKTFGVVCDKTKFTEVMELPVSIFSSKKYETYFSIDLTEADGQPTITGEILAQQAFDGSPVIWVTAYRTAQRGAEDGAA